MPSQVRPPLGICAWLSFLGIASLRSGFQACNLHVGPEQLKACMRREWTLIQRTAFIYVRTPDLIRFCIAHYQLWKLSEVSAIGISLACFNKLSAAESFCID